MTLRQAIGVAALLVSGWLAFFADKTPSSDDTLVAPTRTSTASTSTVTTASTASQATQSPSAAAATDTKVARPLAQATPGRAVPTGIPALAARAPAPPPDAERAGGNAFGALSWTPPPPAPPPPAAPRAPPLPFAFVGKQLEAGTWQVFLSLGEDLRVARVATVIDGRYRVESIAPPQIVFTYLPLNERQTLDIGAP
jgi:hypothetical protein